MPKYFAGFLFCIFFIVGCTLGQTTSIQGTPTQSSNSLTLLSQSFDPSTTPFQPIPPTATKTPPPVTLTPTVQPTDSLASAVHLGLPRPEGQVNILILGSDYRPNRGYRTDVVMVLSLNPQKQTASLTSFPRDLYVDLPGYGMNRINAAQPFGGFALSASTFKRNFDIEVDYYIMTTFNGFKSIIDTLGGINVYAASDLYDKCDLPQAVDKYCFIPAGNNSMNGATVLWYVRSRQSGNDFDRTRRAQEVITAIFQKLMSLNAVNRGAELYDLFINSVETNLPLSETIELLPFGAHILADPSIVKKYSIGPSNITNYIVPETGAMVLLPDPISIGEIIRLAFYQ